MINVDEKLEYKLNLRAWYDMGSFDILVDEIEGVELYASVGYYYGLFEGLSDKEAEDVKKKNRKGLKIISNAVDVDYVMMIKTRRFSLRRLLEEKIGSQWG